MKKKNEYEQLKETLTVVQQENLKLKSKIEELTTIVQQRQEVMQQNEANKQTSSNVLMEMLCKSLINQQFGHVINNNFSAPQSAPENQLGMLLQVMQGMNQQKSGSNNSQ